MYRLCCIPFLSYLLSLSQGSYNSEWPSMKSIVTFVSDLLGFFQTTFAAKLTSDLSRKFHNYNNLRIFFIYIFFIRETRCPLVINVNYIFNLIKFKREKYKNHNNINYYITEFYKSFNFLHTGESDRMRGCKK